MDAAAKQPTAPNHVGSPSRVRTLSYAKPKRCKSAVTNGRRLHVVPPGDTRWARRFRDVLDEVLSDISGATALSEGQRQLARRVATICLACERMEAEAASGKDINLETYGALTDRLGRALQRLGLKRVRDTVPTLADYLAQKALEPNPEQVE